MSQHTAVSSIQHTVHETQLWLKELEDIGDFADEGQAYSALRAVLQALRDRLTVDEAAHLGAQLPTLVRGIYFEGWRPATVPTGERTVEEMRASVLDVLDGGGDFNPDMAIESVFRLLDQRVTEGQVADVKALLPEELEQLWSKAAGTTH